MGVKCKLGELRGELQRVRLNLAGCKGVDTLHMRINVYAMRGDHIRKNLLAEPVYFSVPASEADKTTTVDLRPYEIFVRGDFLISVENLTHMPAGRNTGFAPGCSRAPTPATRVRRRGRCARPGSG